MEIAQRLKTALKEDANVLGLAGAVAMSVALMNPLPLLVGFVAEVAYLLYIPDSHWYSARLSERYDAEIVARRRGMQQELFPALSDTARFQLERLEALREELGSVPVGASNKRRWSEYLRRVDYLLEVLLQLQAKQAKIPADIVNATIPDKDSFALDIPDVEERKRLLAHYEIETEALSRLVTLQKDATRQAVLQRSVQEMERETETIRQELFQVVVAQHLSENVLKTVATTEELLSELPERLARGATTIEGLHSETLPIVQGAERLSNHLSEWLKQSTLSITKK